MKGAYDREARRPTQQPHHFVCDRNPGSNRAESAFPAQSRLRDSSSASGAAAERNVVFRQPYKLHTVSVTVQQPPETPLLVTPHTHMVPPFGPAVRTAGCSVQPSSNPATCMPVRGRRHAAAAGSSALHGRCGQTTAATAVGSRRAGASHNQGVLAASRPWTCTHKTFRASAVADGEPAVLVAEAPAPEQQPGEQQQQQQQCSAPDTYSLLHQLHGLCDDTQGSVAAPAQLHAWAAAAQPQLPCMSLAEVAYMASCLRHHQHLWQHQQQQQQSSPVAGFAVSPGFLYDACAAACAVATASHQDVQHMWTQQQDHQQQQDEVAQPRSTAAADQQQQLVACLHHMLDLLQWAAAEVVQQRQLLQQQLRMQQEQQGQHGGVPVGAAAAFAPLQAYRQQLQQQVEAQQQVQHLLQHPLLLQALPHAHCWQLQQLLVCYGQLGQQPGFDWMGHWLAAARHAMSDLALSYQQQDWHLQHQHGPNWQQHVREHRAAAAAALTQLVGLLSGLAAAHVKPQDAWLGTWEQAARTVLAAQPCFQELEQPGGNGGGSSGSLFSMLQQLLQSVSALGLRLSEEFWTAHEGARGVGAQGRSAGPLTPLVCRIAPWWLSRGTGKVPAVCCENK